MARNLPALRVNRANRNPCPGEWILDSAKLTWDDFTLWLFRNGRAEVEAPDGGLTLEPGSCILFRPRQRYVIRSNSPGEPVLAISVHFDFLDKDGRVLVPPGESLPALHRRVGNPAFLWEILERCVSGWREGTAAGREEAWVWFRAALAEVDRQDARPAYRGLQKEQSAVIERICSDIADNPGAPHTVERMARRFRTSRYHFSRTFRKMKGVTPQDFIVNARMEAARALLQGSSHPVWQIAELLGYRDTYFFSRQFRQKVGVPPTTYRRQ